MMAIVCRIESSTDTNGKLDCDPELNFPPPVGIRGSSQAAHERLPGASIPNTADRTHAGLVSDDQYGMEGANAKCSP
jgi:hypothetical protein